MTRLRATLILILFASALPCLVRAQEQSAIEFESISPERQITFLGQQGHVLLLSNVVAKYKGAVLMADRARLDQDTYEAAADGHVWFQRDDVVWTGEHMEYNFKTGQILAQHFRTGRTPFFAEGRGLHVDLTNHIQGATNGVYLATGAMLTSDDISDPNIKIRARKIRIIPNVRIDAWDAVLYVGEMPIFYFPYYSRNLGEHANNFSFIPGYRTSYGPFVLGSYTWYLNPQLDGVFHVDYREARGIGVGPDLNYHLGRWGEGTFRYYYTHDNDPQTNSVIFPPVKQDRQRVYFAYQANPLTNLNIKSLVRWQNDDGVIHDFFPSEYRQNPQPDSFVEVNKFWQNFSLDVLTRPRINDFYETVERLPDVRLSGFRQQLGSTPVYYESESSAGYYERLFAETNALPQPNFAAARADTYQQLLLPETFFGWLNVTPRVGGRFTYYSQSTGPGGTNDEAYRSILYTGAEASFKASRVWPAAQNRLLDVDGARHIIEPSVNFVYVPDPSVEPNELPQFDYQLPSLRQLPIEFPEYNSIDSIDSQETMRFGLRNKIQTKRAGQIEDLLNWDMSLDWHLKPNQNERSFGDLYSDLMLRPRSWLSLQSQMRYNINGENLRMSLHTLTIQPNTRWSWTLGQFYLRDDFRTTIPTALGQGNNLFTSAFFFRLDENWGFRATQHFDVRSGRMQEQLYTVYRDLRSWTVALTAGVLNNSSGPTDFTVAFTFSFKAMPRYGLGQDTVRSHSLLGESRSLPGD
jgi:lipopolysaccharide assembly outer membrane protein LptD (OstA)